MIFITSRPLIPDSWLKSSSNYFRGRENEYDEFDNDVDDDDDYDYDDDGDGDGGDDDDDIKFYGCNG